MRKCLKEPIILYNEKKELMIHVPVIPDTREAEVGGSQSESGPGKSVRPYLINKLKAKGLGA
jgi:hypothetical protein